MKKIKAGGRVRRSLSGEDIVTRRNIGRRSALSVLGGTMVGATALVSGARPARADRFDVSLQGDPPSDNDSGPFADRPGDADLTVTADGETPPSGGTGVTDQDLSRPGDAKSTDTDIGRGADPFDNDRSLEEDPVGGGQGGRGRSRGGSDADTTQFGDPVDIDTGQGADAGDSDITIPADAAENGRIFPRQGNGGGGAGGGAGGGRTSDPSDADITRTADPIPARDKDPSDISNVDTDITRIGDPADAD